jgi:hypothetical protein
MKGWMTGAAPLQVLLLLCALELIALALMWAIYRDAVADAAATKVRLESCAAAGSAGAGVRQALHESVQACHAELIARGTAADVVQRERDALQEQLAADARGERNRRDDLYANDDSCDAMRRQPVCAAIADRLRVHADAHR